MKATEPAPAPAQAKKQPAKTKESKKATPVPKKEAVAPKEVAAPKEIKKEIKPEIEVTGDASGYDDESDGEDVKAFLEREVKKNNEPKQKAKKQNVNEIIKTQNEAVVQEKVKAAPKAAPKAPAKAAKASAPAQVKNVKVLEKKKTVKDYKGDEWEVVDKREQKIVEKPLDSSDEGSELSYD